MQKPDSTQIVARDNNLEPLRLCKKYDVSTILGSVRIPQKMILFYSPQTIAATTGRVATQLPIQISSGQSPSIK